MNSAPIGIFDSGIGGLTVYRHLKEHLPNENFLYIADNRRNPFGDKTKSEILQINDDIISFFINLNVKLIVVACNTSSALALGHDQEKYQVPFIDMLRDGLWFTQTMPDSARIGIIATQATISSNAYARIIRYYNPRLHIQQKATPELVPLIEQQLYDNRLGTTQSRADNQIRTVLNNHLKDFDSITHLILGCSHYPYVISQIQDLIPDVEIIDPSRYVAKRCKEHPVTIDTEKSLSPSSVFHYTQISDTLIANAKRHGFTDYRLITFPTG